MTIDDVGGGVLHELDVGEVIDLFKSYLRELDEDDSAAATGPPAEQLQQLLAAVTGDEVAVSLTDNRDVRIQFTRAPDRRCLLRTLGLIATSMRGTGTVVTMDRDANVTRYFLWNCTVYAQAGRTVFDGPLRPVG